MDTNKRLMWAVDAEEKETEEMQKKRCLRSPSSSISDEDLQPQEGFDMYSWLVHELGKQLPLCWLLWSGDWSSLLKYTGSCGDSSSSIDSALQFELVSLCHWFLSTEAPEPFKKGANQALKLISSGTSLATQMSFDDQSVYYSLERVLDSKNEELIRQACCAIAFLCWCCGFNYIKDIPFSAGVVDKLFNLVEQDSPHLAHARRAICSIACVDKRVKEKISIKTKLDTHFKWPFLYGDREEAEHACMIVACIVGGNKDDAIWDKIEGVLIPPIVDVMRSASDIPVLVAAAYAISSATDGATPEQIDKLFAMGCLKVLFYNLCVPSQPLVSHILDGIDDILNAGAERGNRKYAEWIEDNDKSHGWVKYADWIDDDNKCPGWVAYRKKYADWIDDDNKCPGWVAFRYVGDVFPDFPYDIKTSVQFRAYDIAFRYGGCGWIYDFMEEEFWYDDEFLSTLVWDMKS